MIKYDMFASDTNTKFSDYEVALTELEKNIHSVQDDPVNEVNEVNEVEGTSINDNDNDNHNDNDNDNDTVEGIMSVDLKNIIKQELSSTSN